MNKYTLSIVAFQAILKSDIFPYSHIYISYMFLLIPHPSFRFGLRGAWILGQSPKLSVTISIEGYQKLPVSRGTKSIHIAVFAVCKLSLWDPCDRSVDYRIYPY